MVRHPPLALRERRWSLSAMSRVIAHRNCQELARRRNWRCRAQQWVSFIILKKGRNCIWFSWEFMGMS